MIYAAIGFLIGAGVATIVAALVARRSYEKGAADQIDLLARRRRASVPHPVTDDPKKGESWSW